MTDPNIEAALTLAREVLAKYTDGSGAVETKPSTVLAEALLSLAATRQADLAEINRLAADNLRLDRLSRCVAIGCGLGGRCDGAGTAQYPCPQAATRQAEAAVVEAAEKFLPKLSELRRQFPPCDSWFARATCTASVEFDRDEWDRMEALRLAISNLHALRAVGK